MKTKVCFLLLFLSAFSIHAFSSRPLLAVPDSVTVAVGGTHAIHLTGYSANLSAIIEDQSIGTLTSMKNAILVKGLAPGNTRIEFSRDNLVQYTKVYVKESAGHFPQNLSMQVTGTKIPGPLLRTMIAQQLNDTIDHNPGTSLSVVIPKKAIPSSFVQGCALSLPVKVKISGRDYLPTAGKVIVNVVNQPVALGAPANLMVSNNPESFSEPSTLFKAPFPDASATRIFYHHYNKGTVPYRFVLELSNLDDSKAQVHVLQGIAGPELREISVGAAATERFFIAEKNHLGRVVEINPENTSQLLSIKVNPKETISGIVQLTPMTASRFSVETKIQSLSGVNDTKMAEEIGEKPKGVFKGPDLTLNGEYTYGGHYAFITLGKQSLLSDIQTGKADQGNYGAFYTIHIKINNPTEESKGVQISFKPQAGPANGIFLVDETRLIKTPVVPAFTYHPLLKYVLAPHETKEVTLKTFAQGGSFYPVSLVVHPLEK